MALFSVLVIQLGFGVNSANAVPCEETLRAFWDEATFFSADYDNPADNIRKGDKVKEIYLTYDTRAYHATTYEMALEKFPMLALGIEEKYGKSCKGPLSGSISNNSSAMKRCLVNYLYDNDCDVSAFKISGSLRKGNQKSSSSSNQSSSSGSSSQSNQKANRQSANNQSNQSSSGDLSKMSSSQLIDFAKSADIRGDFQQAYKAELQLSKDSDPEISRQALRRVGFRLREGQGVNKNLTEAHQLLHQAASMGDIQAHALLCDNYMNGKGISENHGKALEHCLFAAEKGLSGAQGNLAWLYSSGNGIQRNKKLSEEWMCKSAAQGEPAAIRNVTKLNISCN